MTNPKPRHTVEIMEDFSVTIELGALVIENTVVAPAKTQVFHNKTGERRRFDTKKNAEAYCKQHGTKVRYLGKI